MSENRRDTRTAIITLALFAALVAAVCVRRVHEKRKLIELGYQLTSSEREVQRLEEEHRRLRLEVSVLTNPQRLRRLAQSLGMKKPAPDDVIVVDVDAARTARREEQR